VGFDEDELVKKTIKVLNANLRVSKIYFKVETGEQTKNIESKEQLESGEAFVRCNTVREEVTPFMAIRANSSIRYDLVGKIVVETGLTRKAVAKILVGIKRAIFDLFRDNPEEYIVRASNIINEQKATAIIEHIT
jgi:type III restriction enzyme